MLTLLWRESLKLTRLPLFLLVLFLPAGVTWGQGAAGVSKKDKPSYELPQPAVENLDYVMYQRIREEEARNSHAMEFASALADGIGPRLTGSPNLKRATDWVSDQLRAMGCANTHLEDWGEFGMGWQQLNTWARMTSPDTAVFIVQAAPWSPATKGASKGEAVWFDVSKLEDFAKYEGRLTGKIVLLGSMKDVRPIDKSLFERHDERSLAALSEYSFQQNTDEAKARRELSEQGQFIQKEITFIASEHALAIMVPGRRSSEDYGGAFGTIYDDNRVAGSPTYTRDHALQVPLVVAAIENYGRVFRLLKADVPVTIELDVQTSFTGDHEHGYNAIAEIPGTDPGLKDEIVMFGGHLDSWMAGTGAVDDGAGSAVALEVMRILTKLPVKPRRTIRIALWTGEEQGELGSSAYVKEHVASTPISSPDKLLQSEFSEYQLQLKTEHRLISAYYNIDRGGGRLRGVFLQGNAEIRSIFEQWIQPLKDLGVTTLTMRNTTGNDHEPFDAVGIPAFQFIQDELDKSTTIHTNMDTYERLQPNDLAQAAVVEAIFVYNTAMRDQMLPRKPLSRPELVGESVPFRKIMPGAVATEGQAESTKTKRAQ